MPLECFEGRPDQDPVEFVEDFETLATLSRWQMQDLPVIFGVYLKGPAKRWFKTLEAGDRTSFSTLLHNFLAEYKQGGVNWSEEASFNALSQLPYESIHQYGERVITKGHRLGKSDCELLNTFVNGLHSECMTQTIARGPETLQSAIKIAKLCESAQSYKANQGDVKQSSSREIQPSPEEKKMLQCRYCDRTGHCTDDCRTLIRDKKR